MHYEAITRKQRYCQNVQAIGSKKTSECDVLHFACSELHPSWIVHWLLHGLESSLFFSGQSNKKIKNTKHNIYMLLINREENLCHLQTASDISIQCCGNVVNNRWLTLKLHRPSLQSGSFKVFALLSSTAFCPVTIYTFWRYGIYEKTGFEKSWHQSTTFIDDTRFKTKIPF